MMLPSDFPRSSPFVRIINRNPDYKVDQFYQPLQSKSDKSSFILNEKLNTCKNWHPSNSLVNSPIYRSMLSSNATTCSKPGFLSPNQSRRTCTEAAAKAILGMPSIKITAIMAEGSIITGGSLLDHKLRTTLGGPITSKTGPTIGVTQLVAGEQSLLWAEWEV